MHGLEQPLTGAMVGALVTLIIILIGYGGHGYNPGKKEGYNPSARCSRYVRREELVLSAIRF